MTCWPPPPLPLCLRLPPAPPVPPPWGADGAVELVRGNGKGEGSSSTERECGLRNGPEVMGSEDIMPVWGAEALGPRGVGGGDVPSLFRSLRVICWRDEESMAASVER